MSDETEKTEQQVAAVGSEPQPLTDAQLEDTSAGTGVSLLMDGIVKLVDIGVVLEKETERLFK